MMWAMGRMRCFPTRILLLGALGALGGCKGDEGEGCSSTGPLGPVCRSTPGDYAGRYGHDGDGNPPAVANAVVLDSGTVRFDFRLVLR